MTRVRLPLAAILVLAATLPLALARAAPAGDPGPLHGAPLQEKSGVRLLVGHPRPVVLDLDSGRLTDVPGIPPASYALVVGVGARSAVVLAGGRVYAVRGEKPVAHLGKAVDVAPASEGASVWIKQRVSPSHCTLRRARLDGRVLRAPRAFSCGPAIHAGGSLGLQVGCCRVLEARTGRTVFRSRLPIVAVADAKVVLQAGAGRDLTVVDTATGRRASVPWPDTPGRLFGQQAVDASGRFVALQFGNPSWTGPPGQAYDVWLLDTETAKLTRLPSMPAFIWLKFTSMDWTDGGLFVLLTSDRTRQMVALWRPGEDRLHIKSFPAGRDIASNTAAIVR